MIDPFNSETSTVSMKLDVDTRGMRDDIGRAHQAVTGFNAELRGSSQIGRQLGSTLGRAFEGLAIQGRGLGEVVRTLGLSLSRITLNAAFKPLESALGNAFMGLLSDATPAFGSIGKLAGGTPVPFAKGGVIASPTTFPLGRGTGLAGEQGAEAIMPLARGPDGRLGVAATGKGGNTAIVFNVATPDAESFRRSETQIAALLSRAISSGQRNL